MPSEPLVGVWAAWEVWKGEEAGLKLGGGGSGRRSDLEVGPSRRCLVTNFVFFILLQIWPKARRREALHLMLNARSLYKSKS